MNERLLNHDHLELDELLASFFKSLEAGQLKESFDALDLFWARLAMHIRAEHLHLFPALLNGAEAAIKQGRRPAPPLEVVQARVARLRDDHDFFMTEFTAAVKGVRLLRDRRPEAPGAEELCSKVAQAEQRLKAHNELEESEVYGWVARLLDPSEQAALYERMERELANFPPRFRK